MSEVKTREDGSWIAPALSCCNELIALHRKIFKQKQTNKYWPSHFPSKFRVKKIKE